MATPAQGALAKLCMDSVAPIDTSSEPFEFISSTLGQTSTLAYTNGLRGTRSRVNNRVREVQLASSGNLVLNPSVTELDILVQRILGGTTAVGVTDVANALPEFLICIDKVTKVYTYAGCRVARATFSGSPGQPIALTLDIEAETETEANAGTFPALTLDTQAMFVFSDVVLTLDGTARQVSSFQFVIDNVVDTGRYCNTKTRAEIAAQDRIVTLSCNLPFDTGNVDLYYIAEAGIDGSLAWSDGSTTYTWDFGNLRAGSTPVAVPGKSEIMFDVTFEAYQASNGTSQVKVTKS